MRILLAMLTAAGVLCAQSKPVTGCADLRSLTNNQISVAVAMPLPETPEAPAHCRVFGQVLPQVGFEVRMPAEWNGRFMMVGNGGFAGEPTDSRANEITDGKLARSRPLCVYPQMARYKGTGSIDDFANFTCVKP
jgi:hypothetical protein